MARSVQGLGTVRVTAIGIFAVAAAAGPEVVASHVIRRPREVLRVMILGTIASRRNLLAALLAPARFRCELSRRTDLFAVPP